MTVNDATQCAVLKIQILLQRGGTIQIPDSAGLPQNLMLSPAFPDLAKF